MHFYRSSLLLAALALSACANDTCDRSRAIAVSRQHTSTYEPDIDRYSARIADGGSTWNVEVFDPDAGTGGQSLYRIDKQTCKMTAWVGYQ